MQTKQQWLIKADQTESPSSVQNFLTTDDLSKAYKSAPGADNEGQKMDKLLYPKQDTWDVDPVTGQRMRMCAICNKPISRGLLKSKPTDACSCTFNSAAPSYYNPDKNIEIGDASSYPGADELYVNTPEKPAGQDGAYIKMDGY